MRGPITAACFAVLTLLALVAGWLADDSTVYAPGYSYRRFRAIRPGMPRAEVIRSLGPPLSIDPAPGRTRWAYGSPGPTGRPDDPIAILPALTVDADLAGKIVEAWGEHEGVQPGEFLGRPLDDLEARLGPPAERSRRPDRALYWYSKMRGRKGEYVRIVEVDAAGKVWATQAGRVGFYVGEADRKQQNWLEWLE